MNISIIIPAHNESKRISGTLTAYLNHFPDADVHVVVNGSTDDTLKKTLAFKKKHPNLRITDVDGKIGKGGAIIEGFRNAKSDIIGYVDADCSTSPAEFERLVSKINGRDGVIASRWKKGSVVDIPQPLSRRIASRGFNQLVRLLFDFPYYDTQCGCKIFKKEAVHSVVDKIGITDFAFDIDLLYQMKREGYKVREIPSVWNDTSLSKINMKMAVPLMFLSVMRLRMIHSPFKGLVPILQKPFRRMWER